MKNIAIYAPDIFFNDAVGNYCLGLARLIENHFIKISLFAERFASNTSIKIQNSQNLFELDLTHYILFINYSIYDPQLDKLLALNCKKIIYCHGVTPYQFFRGWDSATEEMCRKAIHQLIILNKCDTLITNSKSTKKFLSKYINTENSYVMPPVFFNNGIFNEDVYILQSQEISRIQLIMIGRVTPHKNLEDGLLFLRNLLHKDIDGQLVIAGHIQNKEYFEYILELSRHMGILNKLHFTGSLPDKFLLKYLKASHLLLSMSKHEGFGVPVLEAMHLGIPTLVRSGTATDELAYNSLINPKELKNSNSQFYDFEFLKKYMREVKVKNKQISMKLLSKTTVEEYISLFNRMN